MNTPSTNTHMTEIKDTHMTDTHMTEIKNTIKKILFIMTKTGRFKRKYAMLV